MAGGTVATPSGASLTIPEGALDHATTITVTTTTQAPPTGIGAVSPVYKFAPEGLVFAKPVTVTLPMPAGVTTGSVYWSRLNGTGFDAIGGTVTGSTITARTVHFSLAVIGSASGTRVVTGVGETTWISATTRVSEPIDFTAQPLEALVSNGAGGFVSLPGVAGTGSAAGTFTIADVPVGEYILHSGTEYLVTTSNTPDLGAMLGGRPDSQRPQLTQNDVLTISATGLNAWQDGDSLELFSTEANDWDFETNRLVNLTNGDTSLTLPIDMHDIDAGDPRWIQGSLGDHMVLAQLALAHSATGLPYTAMSRAGQLPSFELNGSAPVGVSIALGDISQDNSIAFDFRVSQYAAAMALDGNPAFSEICPFNPGNCGAFQGVLAQAGLAEDGFYGANADLLLMYDTSGADLNTGAMHYGSPSSLGGSWGQLYYNAWKRGRRYQLPDTSGVFQTGFFDVIEWTTSPTTAASAPITPPVTQPTNLTVNGGSFFANAPSIGAQTTVAWSAPRIGTPAFYELDAVELYVGGDNRTHRRPGPRIITPETGFTFPPGVLDPSRAYVFIVAAWASTSAQAAQLLAASPFKSGIDLASATIISGIFGSVHGQHVPTAAAIQDNQTYPVGLVADGDGVFWTERFDAPWDPPTVRNAANIWMANLDGSNPHILASGQDEAMSIAKDGSSLYWSNVGSQNRDGAIMKMDLSVPAHPITTLIPDESAGAMLVVNGDLFYSSAYGGIRVLRAGQTVPEHFADYGATNLASDGIQLFWTVYGTGPGNSGQVQAQPLAASGGIATLLAIDQPQAWDVHTDGTKVYWSDQAFQQSFDASINSVPVGGGTSSVLATGNEIMKVFTVDATNAYYVSNGVLWSVPLSGATAPTAMIPLSAGGCPEGNMATVNGVIYWTDTCGNAVYRTFP